MLGDRTKSLKSSQRPTCFDAYYEGFVETVEETEWYK